MLEVLLLAAAALAVDGEPAPERADALRTVVTYDNGEFNLPLYTPRWTGRWSQPSAAQEIAAGIARVTGANPTVYSYLPPGRTEGRPGVPHLVQPRLGRCQGAAALPSDPCWCGPADNCWGDLGPNYHPSSSTSLYLTTAAIREAQRERGPRVEIHLTDLFEEDPSAADDPANSDRCVTAAGTRKALEGILRTGDRESLDHLAVGVLRVDVDPPPPGTGSWGWTYEFRQVADSSCWSARPAASWASGRGRYEMAIGVVVLGIGTEARAADVDAVLDGLQAQLAGDAMALRLLRLREPASRQRLTGTLRLEELSNLVIDAPPRPPRLPCDDVQHAVDLQAGGVILDIAGAAAACDGAAVVAVPPHQVQRAFLRRAGVDPRVEHLEVSGRVRLTGTAEPLLRAFDELGAHNRSAGQRPMPLWSSLQDALGLRGERGSRPWRTWSHEIEIDALTITEVDTRPWLIVLLGALASAIAAGLGSYLIIERVDAARAFQTHWDRNIGPGKDPLRQRPLAAVLAEAQEQVRARWGQRVAVAAGIALVAAIAATWILLRLHVVRLG